MQTLSADAVRMTTHTQFSLLLSDDRGVRDHAGRRNSDIVSGTALLH